ncbi:MAG: dTDP-glucose 4,6-dehydratase [Candidatus Heimdallarchaeota archaeon]|nr:MAG: dTDP-glucose 4,6-dehydratase [Candidatus Heimdallarchaeota archaeon]
MAIDLVCIVISIVLSFIIRIEALYDIWPYLKKYWTLFILAPLVRIPVYYLFHLYKRIWRYASTSELASIALSGVIGSAIIAIINFVLLPILNIPHCISGSVVTLEGILSTIFLGCSRFLLRLLQERIPPDEVPDSLFLTQNRRRILIIGAGNAGAMISRMMKSYPSVQESRIIGFIDDDPSKLSMHIHGVPVLGTRDAIPALVKKHHINEAIIAMPSADPDSIDDIYHICSTISLPVRTLPSIYDLLAGSMTFDQLRQLRTIDDMGYQISKPHEKRPIKLTSLMITGGAGFIGSNFVHFMLREHPDYRIVVFDKLTYAGNLDNLQGLKGKYGDRYVFVKGDICEYSKVADVIQHYKIDSIVNFAAESHVDRSLMNPESFLNTNIYGTYSLLRAARHFRVKRFHQVSTDEVYGQVTRGSFSEEDPLETRSPYSATKAGADLLVHAYRTSFGIPVTITRGSNNIGPYQYPEKVVPLFILNALEDQILPVYGDGLYVRDYQYVIDHCRGIDLVLHTGESGEIYNLGAGNEVAAIDLAKMILHYLKKPESLIQLVADRPGQDRRYSLNCMKIKTLGWTPKWTFEKGLEDTINWYLNNEWWWRKLKNAEYWKFYDTQYKERLSKK